MCTHGRFITNKYTGARFFCKCGKCNSCLQEKAIARTNRIRAELSSDWLNVFVTLTYDRQTAPFILQKEVDMCKPVLNVYREFDVRWDVNKQEWIRFRNIGFDGCYRPVDTIKVFDANDQTEVGSSYYYGSSDMKQLKHQRGKVGVCYYKDLQDFLKRLRINLNRYYYEQIPVRYFACSEYGPQSKRPHFHLLIQVQKTSFDVFRNVIIKSWKYGRNIRYDKSIQLVKYDASAYVSSYVNCNNSIPPFLKTFFPPKHSYSQHYGMSFCGYSLTSLLDKVRNGDMQVDVLCNKNGVRDYVSVPIPKYVVNRFFPLFKGYSRFTDSSLYDILRCAESESSIRTKLRFYQAQYDGINYKKPIDYHGDDTHRIAVRLLNACANYRNITGNSVYDFAIDFVTAWRVYRSSAYKRLVTDPLVPTLFKYDNYQDYYLLKDKSRFYQIMGELSYLQSLDSYIIDPNLYPINQSRTAYMERIYDSYDKQKKLTHRVLSDIGVNV